MKNKLIAMTVVLLSMCTGSVMAAVTQVECEKNFSDNTITVNGYAEKGEQVSVHILKDGEISDSTVKESVVYVNQSETDAGGGFCFVVEVRDSGKYNVFVSGEDITVNSHKFPVVFYNSTDYAGVVNRLNEAAGRNDEDAFCSIIKDNAEKLGFDDEINEITDINKIGKLMYSGLNNKTLSADKYQENRDYYKNCAMMIASNEGKLDGIHKYADNIIENNSKLLKYWKQYITSEEKEAFAVKKLQNIKLDNVNELEKNISEVLILTATYYPDGYMSLKDLYSDFKNILEIDSVSSKSSVYSKLSGKDFDDIDELTEAYEKAVDSTKSESGSSGGSGGGGSKITMGGSSLGEMQVPAEKTEAVQEIQLKFIDLGSVRWAYSSISVLFDMGIVSGVSDEEFLPEREVKREEFTKMLVMASGKTPGKYESVFEDVPSDAWYADYVGCAYSEGIVSGVSETMFGVSENITRQDMAVMIYRAMLSNGYNASVSGMDFSDGDKISAYAKEAVSVLAGAGIINGRGDNMFAPGETATRAEAAVIIERALEYLR